MDRRRLLQSLPPFLIASTFPSLSSPAWAAKVQFPAALLIPKTGQHAALGRSMERAALLAQGGNDPRALMVFDTMGTAVGAAAAARAARKAGATVILGPVFAIEVSAVVATVGDAVPVITFSNDSALLERGAFLLGITPNQVVSTILKYAAGRGIRRLAIGGGGDTWSAQSRVAATSIGGSLGLETYLLPPEAATTLAPMGGAAAEGLPDAVLMSTSAGLAGIAATAAAQGVQVLGAIQALDLPPPMLRDLEGAWLAAPDPERFAGFARNFEQRNGGPPGTIAGLAFDAVNIVQQLRRGGGTDRSALLAANGFKAICGDVRFRTDGSAARGLAVIAVSRGALRTVAPAALP